MDSETLDNQARLLEATRRLQELLSTGSGPNSTSAELDALKVKFSEAVEQLHETRHRLLTSQDSLLGSEAENGQLRRKLQAEIEERNKLENHISEIRSSASWRIGNTLVRQAHRLTGFRSKR
jgi:DNA repair ATPase RecN